MITLENFPLVEQHVTNMQAAAQAEFNQLTTDAAIEHMRHEFDHEGPFYFARKHGLLVNGSGEELAVQFMTVYNARKPGTY